MYTVWSLDTSAVKIYGDYAPLPLIVNKDVVEYLGGAEETFHAIHNWRKAGFLPRTKSTEAYPFSMLDIQLTEYNAELGWREWRFGTVYPSVNEFVRGYYRMLGNTAVFYGGTRVELPQTETEGDN